MMETLIEITKTLWILLSSAVPTLPPKAGDLCHPLSHFPTLPLPLFHYSYLLPLVVFLEVFHTYFISAQVLALHFIHYPSSVASSECFHGLFTGWTGCC